MPHTRRVHVVTGSREETVRCKIDLLTLAGLARTVKLLPLRNRKLCVLRTNEETGFLLLTAVSVVCF